MSMRIGVLPPHPKKGIVNCHYHLRGLRCHAQARRRAGRSQVSLETRLKVEESWCTLRWLVVLSTSAAVTEAYVAVNPLRKSRLELPAALEYSTACRFGVRRRVLGLTCHC